jgi:hypothetical protein
MAKRKSKKMDRKKSVWLILGSGLAKQPKMFITKPRK